MEPINYLSYMSTVNGIDVLFAMVGFVFGYLIRKWDHEQY